MVKLCVTWDIFIGFLSPGGSPKSLNNWILHISILGIPHLWNPHIFLSGTMPMMFGVARGLGWSKSSSPLGHLWVSGSSETSETTIPDGCDRTKTSILHGFCQDSRSFFIFFRCNLRTCNFNFMSVQGQSPIGQPGAGPLPVRKRWVIEIPWFASQTFQRLAGAVAVLISSMCWTPLLGE